MCARKLCVPGVGAVSISLSPSSQTWGGSGLDLEVPLPSHCPSELAESTCQAPPIPHLRAVFPSLFLMTQDESVLGNHGWRQLGPARLVAAQTLRATWVLRAGTSLALSLAGWGLCLCLTSGLLERPGLLFRWSCSLLRTCRLGARSVYAFRREAGGGTHPQAACRSSLWRRYDSSEFL